MNTPWRRTLSVVAVCALGITIGSTWHTAVANPARTVASPTAVAVIDINRVIQGLAEFSETVARLENEIRSSERSIQELTARMRTIEAELETLDRNGHAFASKWLERLELQSNRETRAKNINQRLDLLRGEAMRSIYLKISDATVRLGESEGWDLILLDDRSLVQLADEAGLITGTRMNDFVINRRTLHVSPRADVTDQIITMMNNEYKAARR